MPKFVTPHILLRCGVGGPCGCCGKEGDFNINWRKKDGLLRGGLCDECHSILWKNDDPDYLTSMVKIHEEKADLYKKLAVFSQKFVHTLVQREGVTEDHIPERWLESIIIKKEG